MAMEINILEFYQNTDYCVDGFNQPINIGSISKEADKFLKENSIYEWAYITAYNPLSISLSLNENERRNNELKTHLKKYVIINGEGQDKSKLWPPEKSFFIGGISLENVKALACKFGQKAIVYGSLGNAAQLIETLNFIGNAELITMPKNAFLCSRKIPASVVLKCYDWAIAQRESGVCIISGFHSQIEKDVLHYLLKGTQPIILALARGLKQKVEKEFEEPIKQGRLLIITPFAKEIKRVTEQTAQVRNKMMIDLADSITVGYASADGSLEAVLKGIDNGKEIFKLV